MEHADRCRSPGGDPLRPLPRHGRAGRRNSPCAWQSGRSGCLVRGLRRHSAGTRRSGAGGRGFPNGHRIRADKNGGLYREFREHCGLARAYRPGARHFRRAAHLQRQLGRERLGGRGEQDSVLGSAGLYRHIRLLQSIHFLERSGIACGRLERLGFFPDRAHLPAVRQKGPVHGNRIQERFWFPYQALGLLVRRSGG